MSLENSHPTVKHLKLAVGVMAFLLGGAFSYGEVSPEQSASGKDAWEQTLERILSKEGIEMGGVFRSQFLFSSISRPTSPPNLRTEEGVEFTSVDFDIRARPNTSTQGHVIFRMHQDWRNFFSDVGNPIFTRWISLDGEVAQKMFSYHAGDFRQHYSPLTLWSPDLEVVYEPLLFAKERQAAMDEVFLGNNDRMLQGVDLNFDAEVSPILKTIHFNLLGARLRNVETSVANGNKPTDAIEKSDVEKYLASGNLDVSPLNGLNLGTSYLRIFDKKANYTGPNRADDTSGQLTNIVAFRAGIQLDELLNKPVWALGLNGEIARSADDTSFYADTSKTKMAEKSLTGTALRIDLNMGWHLDKLFGFRISAGFLKNERLYRNELAQTPSFVGERILNTDNDTNFKVIKRVNSSSAPNYSTMDAMYRTVFKFAPIAATNSWTKAPFSKNSYNHSIMTQSEIAATARLRLDSALQLVMPFGPATANRVGPVAKLTLSGLDDNIQAQLNWSALENIEGEPLFYERTQVVGGPKDTVRINPKSKFTDLGFGAKAEVPGIPGWENHFTLSGYFGKSSADNAGIDSVIIHHKATTTQMHAGFYWNFWKRAALLGGWMQFVTDYERGKATAQVIQNRYAGGLEYKIAPGAYIDGTVGKVAVDRPDSFGNFEQLQTSLDLRVGF